MRILHLTTQLPSPYGADGGSLRQFELCRWAVEAGNEVTVVAPVSQSMSEAYRPAERFDASGIRFVATPRRGRRELDALDAFRRQPKLLTRPVRAPYYGLQSEIFLTGMQEAIRAELARAPDVVTVEHDFAVSLGNGVVSTPKVLMTHNVSSAYYKTRMAESSSWLRRGLMRIESQRMASYVHSRIEDFDGIVTVSTQDGDLFRDLTDTPIFVVPNGTGLEPVAGQPIDRATLLFTGTMSYPPNREGILWFAAEIWPRILGQIPETRLLVVGRQPDRRATRLASTGTNIEVIGEVPEMRPYFERSTAVIAPLRSGGGTRLKILDAFAAGRPVVSTSLGAQGLDAADGYHLLLGDEPATFAAQVVRLLREPDLRMVLSANGRRLVDDTYHWRAIAQRYVDALEAVVAGQRGGHE